MNDRQRNTPRLANSSGHWWPAHLEHVTRAATDISQLHTQLLQRPTSTHISVDAQTVDPTRSPLPEPTLPSACEPPVAPALAAPDVQDPRTNAIAAHLTDAIRLRKEAEGWLNILQTTAALAADASAHWLELVHVVGRTPQQNQAYKQLEQEILDYSRRLATVRQRWSACMAQAREHEESARFLQDATLL